MEKIVESSVVICSYDGHFIGAVDDIRNTKHKRNPYNVIGFCYNCFGYAFQSYLWLQPILTADFIQERRDEEDYWYSDERDISEYNYFPVDIEDTEISNLLQALDDDEDELDNILYNEYDSDKAVSLMTHNILNCFPDVRLISSFDELAEDEYGIEMRTDANDFHFARYNPKSGWYTAKNGAQEIVRARHSEELFTAHNHSYIYGQTFFAKKRV